MGRVWRGMKNKWMEGSAYGASDRQTTRGIMDVWKDELNDNTDRQSSIHTYVPTSLLTYIHTAAS